MKLALPILLLSLAACPALAQVRPEPGSGDPRVQSVEYSAEQVVLLQSAPGYQVTVEFAPDERIENVAVGDSGAWQATPNKRGDRLFVKPLQSGTSTNMVVVTDARQYVFDLRPLYGPSTDMAYTVRFRYPAAPGAAAAATDAATVEAPHGRYHLSGAAAIRPSAIDDDGTHTYIEWPADRTLPAVYAVDSHGGETLINGMMRDGVYVIDSVAPALVFRLDRQVARAVRATPKARS